MFSNFTLSVASAELFLTVTIQMQIHCWQPLLLFVVWNNLASLSNCELFFFFSLSQACFSWQIKDLSEYHSPGRILNNIRAKNGSDKVPPYTHFSHTPFNQMMIFLKFISVYHSNLKGWTSDNTLLFKTIIMQDVMAKWQCWSQSALNQTTADYLSTLQSHQNHQHACSISVLHKNHINQHWLLILFLLCPS